MNTNSAKVAAVTLGLVSTWATAQADDFIIRVTPDQGQSIDTLQIFSAKTNTSGVGANPVTNPGTTVQSDQDLSSSLGSVTGGTTLTTTISTSYGTSSSLNGLFDGDEATFGLLATSNGFAVLGGSTIPVGMTYADQYGSTGISQADALAGIQSGSLAAASSLFPNMSSNALYTAVDGSTAIGQFYRFEANGDATRIGTWSAQPVPEPATMVALGVGALGLMKRRRKLA